MKTKRQKPQERKAQDARATRYRATDKGREMVRRTARQMYRKYPDRAIARAMVGHAVKTGKLIPPPECGNCHLCVRVEAHHHHGYDKAHWYDVRWLCKQCHMEAER